MEDLVFLNMSLYEYVKIIRLVNIDLKPKAAGWRPINSWEWARPHAGTGLVREASWGVP